MNIMSVCEEPTILEVIRIIVLFINIIKVVVPIILIIVLMIRLTSAITNNKEDVLESVKRTAPKNIVAAILIFLVPTMVNLIGKITFPNSDYAKCISGITIDKVRESYNNKAEKLVKEAEESKNINDYTNAKSYLINIKDQETRKELEERLELVKSDIDKKNNENKKNTSTASTGFGRTIQLDEKSKKACQYVLNADTTMIRLYRCDNRYNSLYPSALPGGGRNVTMPGQGRGDPPYETQIAKEAIPFSRYMKGAFSYEMPGTVRDSSLYEAAKVFMLMFNGDFLGDYRFKINSAGEIQFPIGTCTQCYSEANMIADYDSGKDKEAIDNVFNEMRYFLLINDDGSLTGTTYNKKSGIIDVLYNSSRAGKNYKQIIEDLKSGHGLAHNFKNANLYDCRNLIDDGSY